MKLQSKRSRKAKHQKAKLDTKIGGTGHVGKKMMVFVTIAEVMGIQSALGVGSNITSASSSCYFHEISV